MVADPSRAPRVEDLRALGPWIRDEVAASTDPTRLPDAVVEALRDRDVLRLAVPHEYDGPEVDPLTQIAVVEELSRHDGSVGWCAMIAIAGSYVASFLEPDAAAEVFGHRDACIAGLLRPAGRADVVDDGYRVSGHFRFASGSAHASAMLGGCLVYRDGELARGDNGIPEMRVLLVEPDQCTMLDTWHTTGLLATGSHDYDIADVFVPAARSWDPSGAMRIDRPMYRYPPLFLAVHAGVPLGLAAGSIEEVEALATTKDLFPTGEDRPPGRLLGDDRRAQESLARAQGLFDAARAHTYGVMGELWDTLQGGDRPSQRQRARYRIMLTQVHEMCRDVIALMYDTASTDAIYRTSPLDRQLRDIQTACQHRMVNEKIYEPAGRVLLGQPSGDPFV